MDITLIIIIFFTKKKKKKKKNLSRSTCSCQFLNLNSLARFKPVVTTCGRKYSPLKSVFADEVIFGYKKIQVKQNNRLFVLDRKVLK